MKEWCTIEEARQRLGLTVRSLQYYLTGGLLEGKKSRTRAGRMAWSHVTLDSVLHYQQTHRPHHVCKPPPAGCSRCGIMEGPFTGGLCGECRRELETGHHRFCPSASLLASTLR